MKLRSLIIVTVIFFAASFSQAQDMNIAVSYLLGEKSKDSHSTTESIVISGADVSYSVKYSGRKGDNEVDMNKTCEFSEQDLKNIRKTIETKALNVTDSLFSESFKSKSYEVYTNIAISISLDGKDHKIRINGDTLDFKDRDLYKNSVYFITMLSKMAKECK